MGTKADTRNDKTMIEKLKTMNQKMVTPDEAHELARRIKAIKFIECSAKTGENLKTVFDEAIKAVLFNKSIPH